FAVRDATDWESWDRDTNLAQSVYVGQNPEEGAYINYWLADAPAAMAEDGAGMDEGAEPRGNGSDGVDGSAPGIRGAQDAASERSQVVVRITDSSGRLVRELEDPDAEPGVNRVVWDLTWEGPEPVPGEGRGGGGGFFGGPSGPPASPGVYTATLRVGDEELSTDFRVRGDPAVEASQADYVARTEAALRARDLESRLNRMIGVLADLDGQVGELVEVVRGQDVEASARILELSAEARRSFESLENDLRRPPPDMGYRQYPRLSEEASRLGRAIGQAQARPTEGQLEALGDVESEAAAKASELQEILDGPVRELNELLEGLPRLMVDWNAGERISLGAGG
ncbi:MAG: hypothetical protein PVI57_23055, partial [Gemmatimonadota bacterium]